LLFLAGNCALGAAACGAGMNAVYEGDVRFEHCMALDEDPREKPPNRKDCWDDWVAYYTFGQTRDRVDYARRRQRQLAQPGDLGAEAVAQPVLAQRAVPEPINVMAPPPMILADAGKPPEADAGVDAGPDAGDPPAAACASQCRDVWTPCKQACTNAACEKTCAASYKRCMKRCF
jgi:hypothetical protein